MSARELAWTWIGSLAYTALVVGEAYLFPALLGDTWGFIVTLVVALAPVIAATFYAIRL